MPFQVIGQFVTTKSSRLPHVAGCDGAFAPAASGAFVTMMSSADASVANAAPASRSIKPDLAVRQAMRAIAPSCRSMLYLPTQAAEFSDQLRRRSTRPYAPRPFPNWSPQDATSCQVRVDAYHPTPYAAMQCVSDPMAPGDRRNIRRRSLSWSRERLQLIGRFETRRGQLHGSQVRVPVSCRSPGDFSRKAGSIAQSLEMARLAYDALV